MTSAPVQLVRVEHNGQLVCPSKGSTSLKNMQFYGLPVYIIIVSGTARSGKSVRLNALLRRLHVRVSANCKFLSSSSNSAHVTLGIWMWPEPLPMVDDARNVVGYVVLLDTQGTQLGDEKTNHKLTAVSWMLASTVVDNMLGAPNAETVRGLCYMMDMMQSVVGFDATLLPNTVLLSSRDLTVPDVKEDGAQHFAKLAPTQAIPTEFANRLDADTCSVANPVLLNVLDSSVRRLLNVHGARCPNADKTSDPTSKSSETTSDHAAPALSSTIGVDDKSFVNQTDPLTAVAVDRVRQLLCRDDRLHRIATWYTDEPDAVTKVLNRDGIAENKDFFGDTLVSSLCEWAEVVCAYSIRHGPKRIGGINMTTGQQLEALVETVLHVLNSPTASVPAVDLVHHLHCRILSDVVEMALTSYETTLDARLSDSVSVSTSPGVASPNATNTNPAAPASRLEQADAAARTAALAAFHSAPQKTGCLVNTALTESVVDLETGMNSRLAVRRRRVEAQQLAAIEAQAQQAEANSRETLCLAKEIEKQREETSAALKVFEAQSNDIRETVKTATADARRAHEQTLKDHRELMERCKQTTQAAQEAAEAARRAGQESKRCAKEAERLRAQVASATSSEPKKKKKTGLKKLFG